jgi:beta-glucosidase
MFVPSFQAAVNAGVMSAMEGYQDIGGVPVVSSNEYLDRLLRLKMGFDGMLVTGRLFTAYLFAPAATVNI